MWAASQDKHSKGRPRVETAATGSLANDLFDEPQVALLGITKATKYQHPNSCSMMKPVYTQTDEPNNNDQALLELPHIGLPATGVPWQGF
jgi:hypothetical protein